jgi:hypothetical protein
VGQFILTLAGVVCLVVALAFGLAGQTVSVSSYSSGGTVSGSAPGPAAQGAACGFAIAGGLCFLGAAVASRYAQRDRASELAARNEELEERLHRLERELEARVADWKEGQPQGGSPNA